MRIGLAQLNSTIGDFSGNLERLRNALTVLAAQRPDLVVFPEMFITGYPPRDLLHLNWFLDRAEQAQAALKEISSRFQGGILVGGVCRSDQETGKGLYNVALFYFNGQEVFRQAKSLLPFYDVFDEQRYFDPAPAVRVFEFNGRKLGISVCEDAWNSPDLLPGRVYQFDPIAEQARLGADLFINIAASPFWLGKGEIRFRLVREQVLKYHRPFVLLNCVGANDELVFDGGSFVLAGDGTPILALPWFEEALEVVDIASPAPAVFTTLDDVAAVYQALVLGLRDYVRKCGFKKVVLGLSGGIDSAVVACVASAALGKENVLGVTMPSEFSSRGSVEESRQLARNLGIEIWTIPITPVHHAYLKTMDPLWPDRERDVTEENIQARIRGNILMAISNKLGYLVLSTGNKSELAVGYCTIYGDMTGGLAVLADVPKTMVYKLAAYINREREIIPGAIIAKAPSAELRPNQKDQDTLPPYEILDSIIERYVDRGLGLNEIINQGFDPATVRWVINQIDRSEYKRRQAPPGIKMTSRAFGSGRRFPIAVRYQH